MQMTQPIANRFQRAPDARASLPLSRRGWDGSRRLVIAILRIYKRWISPLLPSACRYHPTCSEYMLQAVEKHGVARGVWMGVKRLARCHPFHAGGFDPVR